MEQILIQADKAEMMSVAALLFWDISTWIGDNHQAKNKLRR
jgi:hypothetical protein